jgi:hypothetical protein
MRHCLYLPLSLALPATAATPTRLAASVPEARLAGP